MESSIEAIRTKRSIRTFTGEPIPNETLQELITLGTMASTGSNLQPWGFVVIQDEAELDALAQEIKEYVLTHLKEFPHFASYEDALNNPDYHVLNHATAMIFIYGNSNSHWYVYDGSLAAGNIMLAAQEMGIGTCWIGWCETICNSPEFKKKYNVPEEFELVTGLSCGYMEKKLSPPKRKPPVIFHL